MCLLCGCDLGSLDQILGNIFRSVTGLVDNMGCLKYKENSVEILADIYIYIYIYIYIIFKNLEVKQE